MSFCDLHVHSNYSDGTCAPAELITLAEGAGLSALALCDHNTVAGLPSFLAAAEDSAVEGCPVSNFRPTTGVRSCTSWVCSFARNTTPPSLP